MEILQPSNACRWVPCPGSVKLCRAIPQELTDRAKEGQLAHKVAAQLLRGETPQEIDSPELMRVIEDYVKIVPENCEIEKTIKINILGPESEGRPDAYKIENGTLTLWQLHTGHREINAFENWQCLCYVLGIIEQSQETINYVFIKLVQPRVYDNQVSTWGSSIKELQSRFEKIEEAVNIAMGAVPKSVAGEQCRYCRARAVCRTFANEIGKILDTKHVATTTELEPDQVANELSFLKTEMNLMKIRVDALEERAISQIQNGAQVPGFELKKKLGRKKWNKPLAEIVLMGKMFYGIDLGIQSSVTPAQAIKKGIPEDIINKYSEVPENGFDLIVSKGSKFFK